MKKILPILQIFTGVALAVLVVNDFFELLVEYLFNVSDLKLPIEFSKPDGWKLKFWMMDHPPAFDLYQILFFGVGFAMLFLGLFRFVPDWSKKAIVGGLVASSLLVLLFPQLHYITQETPRPFMIGQLLAGLALVPAMLQSKNISRTSSVVLYVAAGLVLVLLVFSVWKTPITLRYAVFPALGVLAQFILQSVNKNKTSIS